MRNFTDNAEGSQGQGKNDASRKYRSTCKKQKKTTTKAVSGKARKKEKLQVIKLQWLLTRQRWRCWPACCHSAGCLYCSPRSRGPRVCSTPRPHGYQPDTETTTGHTHMRTHKWTIKMKENNKTRDIQENLWKASFIILIHYKFIHSLVVLLSS